jgi:hypothetical protein
MVDALSSATRIRSTKATRSPGSFSPQCPDGGASPDQAQLCPDRNGLAIGAVARSVSLTVIVGRLRDGFMAHDLVPRRIRRASSTGAGIDPGDRAMSRHSHQAGFFAGSCKWVARIKRTDSGSLMVPV